MPKKEKKSKATEAEAPKRVQVYLSDWENYYLGYILATDPEDGVALVVVPPGEDPTEEETGPSQFCMLFAKPENRRKMKYRDDKIVCPFINFRNGDLKDFMGKVAAVVEKQIVGSDS